MRQLSLSPQCNRRDRALRTCHSLRSVPPLILQGFVIEHKVAESLEAGICNLILKLLAHTFGCLCALPAAGTVSSGALELFSDSIDNLLIGLSLIFMFATSFLIMALSYRRTKHVSVTRSRYGKFLYKRERAVKWYLTYCFTALCL